EIDLISGHLTSTKADPLEIINWQKALNLTGDQMPIINTPKSMIGHCIAGAGSIESVACALQLHNGFIHPNINIDSETLHPDIAAILPEEKTPTQTINQEVNTIIKANFGFGDLNCCLVFRKFEG
ncbi:MAG: beta-ketoacyl-[acyl-carrier-protein] synthase family protein, partial [Cyclobacteriaceae bacterium]